MQALCSVVVGAVVAGSVFTWSQLLGVLEPGIHTELAIGETPYLDYFLNIDIDGFRFPESTPSRNMTGIDSGLYRRFPARPSNSTVLF